MTVMRCVVVALLVAGCSKQAAPEYKVTSFGNFESISTWVKKTCGSTMRQTQLVVDPAMAQEAHVLEQDHCLAFGTASDVDVQLRGFERACGLRIYGGLTAAFEPKQLLPLFTDAALGQRVVDALAMGKATYVDGLFVGLSQDTQGYTELSLIIDGCGHRDIDAARDVPSM